MSQTVEIIVEPNIIEVNVSEGVAWDNINNKPAVIAAGATIQEALEQIGLENVNAEITSLQEVTTELNERITDNTEAIALRATTEYVNDEIGNLVEYVNLFDKTAIVVNRYVSPSTGALTYDGTSSVTGVFAVKSNTVYYLSGRTGTTSMVFYDAIGTKLKPRDEFGVERPNFSTYDFNGAIKSPPTAVSVQFTVRFVGVGNIDGTMFSEFLSSVYVPYGVLWVKQSLLPSTIDKNKLFSITKIGSNYSVRTYFDDVYDVFVSSTSSSSQNNLINISSAKLLTKAENTSDTGIALNGASADDAAPTFFNNNISGGNHGIFVYKITKTSHGKTLADVGAIYTDALSNKFTIISINNSNEFTIAPKNTSLTTTWTFPVPNTDLTYFSDGLSTSKVTWTAISSSQLYPSVKNVVQKLIIDGIEKPNNGTYYGDKVFINESYDIIDFPDMVNKLTTNRPVGGYLTQPLFTNGDAIINITNVYQYQKKGTISLICTWNVKKDIYLDRYFGITQNGFVTPTWATTVRRYHPSLLPVTNNGNVYDFRLKPEFKTVTLTGTNEFTSAFWEDAKPTSRVVDMLQSSSLNINFNLGFLPVGDDRSLMVNSAWELTSSKKLYPHFLDSKIGASNIVSAGVLKQGVVFRGWSKPIGIRTNDFLVENGGKYYLILDYHQIGNDFYELPTELDGKSITVLRKSTNVTVSSLVVGGVNVSITTSSPMYGYCELLIS